MRNAGLEEAEARIKIARRNINNLRYADDTTLMAESEEELKSICLQYGRPEFDLWVRKIPWRRKWQPTPVFLPGKFHGWRSLVGYGPWGRKELDTTERLHFHFQHLYKAHCCYVYFCGEELRVAEVEWL